MVFMFVKEVTSVGDFLSQVLLVVVDRGFFIRSSLKEDGILSVISDCDLDL